MKKKISILIITTLLFTVLCATLSACNSSDWTKKFDTALPDLDNGKWENTLHTDFTHIDNMQELYDAHWAPSPHGLRNYEYWCDQMIDFTPNGLIVRSEQRDNHVCDICKVTNGVFTGGIETRPIKTPDGQDVGFTQAFGYYEATVIVPTGTGMWSAFWLQSDDCGKVGNGGKDGTEIDIYESSFGQNDPYATGQALHYDAYDAPWYRTTGNVSRMEYSLYDGAPHKYALLWTPEKYVMYVDDIPVWASNDGGVARTPEFLRLTVEIRDGGWGPYGQKIGQFQNRDDGSNDFIIQEVKVYQNTDYIPEIMANSDYKDMTGVYITLMCIACVVIVAAVGIIVFAIYRTVKRKKAAQTK